MPRSSCLAISRTTSRAPRLGHKLEWYSAGSSIPFNLDQRRSFTPNAGATIPIPGTGILHSYLPSTVFNNEALACRARVPKLNQFTPRPDTDARCRRSGAIANFPLPLSQAVKQRQSGRLRCGRRPYRTNSSQQCGRASSPPCQRCPFSPERCGAHALLHPSNHTTHQHICETHMWVRCAMLLSGRP